MSVRFNPDLYSSILSGLNVNNLEEANAQQELATGRRVNQPSDDPGATAVAIGIHWQSAQDDQFSRNISSVSGLLQTADSTMSSVVTALNQAITLGVQSGDSSLSASNRTTISTQIQDIATQVLSLANTTYQGSYIFAGTNSAQPAYVANASSPNGVTYQGNSATNQVQIAQGQNITVNVPGSQIFSNSSNDVFTALTNLAQAAQSGSGVDTAVAQLRSAFDYVSTQRTFYGSQLNQIQTTTTFLQNDKLQLASQENDATGIDLAQAATDVQKALTERSAILAAGSKIQNVSLLDYLQG
ncbi:MAG TPA: flagellar hook-associated protein FlgL [Candidatus Angelobacter sp.]|nr:flagellar hook-associated protein FlgL [Candidatus Angelobacter sp.]